MCSIYIIVEKFHLSLAVAVGDVGSNARGVDDVKQRQVLHLPGQLEEERHGLPDATRRTHHGYLATATNAQKCDREGPQKVRRSAAITASRLDQNTCGWVNCATMGLLGRVFLQLFNLATSIPGMQLISACAPKQLHM